MNNNFFQEKVSLSTMIIIELSEPMGKNQYLGIGIGMQLS